MKCKDCGKELVHSSLSEDGSYNTIINATCCDYYFCIECGQKHAEDDPKHVTEFKSGNGVFYCDIFEIDSCCYCSCD